MKKEYQNPQLSISFKEFKTLIKESNIKVSSLMIEDYFHLLDGNNTTETVIGSLIIKGYELEKVVEILKWLNNNNVLNESRLSDFGKLSKFEKEYFEKQINLLGSYIPEEDGLLSISKTGLKHQVRLKESTVFIVGSGESCNQLTDNLIKIGIGSINVPNTLFISQIKEKKSIQIYEDADLIQTINNSKPDILVYCSDNFSIEECLEYNRICLEYNIPFIPYKRTYMNIEIGPLVIPKQTACFYCADCRKKSTSLYLNDFENDIILKSFDRNLNFPIGIEYLTLEVLKFVSKMNEPYLKNKLYYFDFVSGATAIYPVFRLPRCKECGINKLNPRKKLWEI